jgi:hypothetical protein
VPPVHEEFQARTMWSLSNADFRQFGGKARIAMKTQAYSLWIARIAASSRLRIAREKVAQAVGRGTPDPLPSRKVNATAFCVIER